MDEEERALPKESSQWDRLTHFTQPIPFKGSKHGKTFVSSLFLLETEVNNPHDITWNMWLLDNGFLSVYQTNSLQKKKKKKKEKSWNQNMVFLQQVSVINLVNQACF